MIITLDKFFPLFDDGSRDEAAEINFKLYEEIRRYHESLLRELERLYKIAERARSLGLDPKPHVEIPVARNMAERVEKLLDINGIARKIEDYENAGLSRVEICFRIAKDIVSGEFGNLDKETAMDKAVRAAVAIQTEGVVAAPIEGIAKIRLDRNLDGSEFVKIYYAGPIRSAGGTAQVISVLVADYVRRLLGLNRYIPTEEEILRYCEEIPLYKKVANLQYLPSDDEIRLIVENCPVCIDGEPTEDAEVSGYRNLPRVETNRVRGGMALVIAEGIALKAPKLKKIVDKIKIDGWEWLDKLINKDSGGSETKDESKDAVKPKDKYLADIVAGRPVFSHPSRKGGFRLRYGRARNSGFATVGLNPATMVIAGGFIAIGTQLKVERPGKAGSVIPVTSIDGPTVRLKNGDVVRVNSYDEAVKIRDSVEKILDMGEILINFGDFLENNHPLIPAGYCYEWWVQEVRGKIPESDYTRIDEDTALSLCDNYGVPLHPDYTYLWHDISAEDALYLRDYIVKNGKIEGKYGKSSLIIKFDRKAKEILEDLLVEHKIREGYIVLERWKVLARCLGLNEDLKIQKDVKLDELGEHPDGLEFARKASCIDIRAKAPSRIGARMGRPEKSKERMMSPAPHMLFPLGEAGGKTRDLKKAVDYTKGYNATKGEIEVELPLRACPECGRESFYLKCSCGAFTEQHYLCPACGIRTRDEVCERCGRETTGYKLWKVNVRELYHRALENIGERDSNGTIKGVIGLTSRNKFPERMEKGILRAKNKVYVFKDGTVRYDMTDLPVTHFRPKEIGLTVEKLKELGYEYDYLGNDLRNEDQIVELKPQDLILSKSAGEYLFRVSKFVDELLVKFYGLEPFYNAEKPEDLIGHLVIGLAPHTSAGVLGRIIGFADVNAGYAHPYFHAAKRRNCDGDEDCVMLLMDGLLNFSREFLPDKRGGQMDAPLVLTAILDPKEVDGEVHNMDVTDSYPLEFYLATLRCAHPKEFSGVIERVEDRLGDERKYFGLKFTHDTDDIALGIKSSAYKTLKSMQDKVSHQMELARKIRAVDEHDVAERVIKTHFLPDIIGNLRAFSRQEFRCVNCNQKFRRIPLAGKCTRCGGSLTLTVHEGSIVKYLDLSKTLAETYNVSDYTRQRIRLIEVETQSLFESELKRQIKIDEFF
ncbi:DNA polymerase II large subunit [Geoglobus acetivorans]|uniref:DNA polymerase II large subunit n=1 Tax=Geoglobus acetivorans TaxID=565033 RepID=A0ABZ3H5D3_GEOAI|nr:DNA polymerase II large subunit [Geoglobus acetivorans]